METNLQTKSHRITASPVTDEIDQTGFISGSVSTHERISGEVIGKIISSGHYVNEDARIGDAAQFLSADENIFCFGVVDKDMKCRGVVRRKDIFDLLGQPFGRDLYRNKNIGIVMRDVPSFFRNKNIFSVSEKIKNDLGAHGTKYYYLFDAADKFSGIFSTKDMLVYLSEITRKEIQMAHRVQTSITKEESHYENDCIEIICGSKMAKGIGGDYYHVNEYDSGKWIFSLCDVSGKGISASLVSTVIGGMFSIYDFKTAIPGFIAKLNSYLYKTFESDKFVTSVIADFDEKTGQISLYDMGHAITYLFRNGKLYRINLEEYGSIPLGIAAKIDPNPAKLELQPGDIFLIMSDGIEEQVNGDNESYGQSRVQSILVRNKHAGLTLIEKALYDDVNAFREGYPQHDDMTVLMIRYKGSSVSDRS